MGVNPCACARERRVVCSIRLLALWWHSVLGAATIVVARRLAALPCKEHVGACSQCRFPSYVVVECS